MVLALTMLFVMAFAYQASAFSAEGNDPFTYTGKIVSLDNEGKILSVQAGPNDELAFQLHDGGVVMRCGAEVPFGDLRTGDMVTVSYFDKATDLYIANEIDLPMKRC